jgi:hypothetical protein
MNEKVQLLQAPVHRHHICRSHWRWLSRTLTSYVEIEGMYLKSLLYWGQSGPVFRVDGWPVWDKGAEDSMLTVLRSGNWYREWGNKFLNLK